MYRFAFHAAIKEGERLIFTVSSTKKHGRQPREINFHVKITLLEEAAGFSAWKKMQGKKTWMREKKKLTSPRFHRLKTGDENIKFGHKAINSSGAGSSPSCGCVLILSHDENVCIPRRWLIKKHSQNTDNTSLGIHRKAKTSFHFLFSF